MVELVDYGGGNLGSVERALQRLGQPYSLTDRPSGNHRLILPGVGTVEELKRAYDIGVRSVRVATHCTEADVSKQHIGIARDLGSTNGTKINGQRFREAALSPDTVITIGQTPLRFQLVPSREAGQRTRQQASQSRAAQQPQVAQRPRSSTPQASHPRPQGSDNSNQAAQPGIDQDFWRGL